MEKTYIHKENRKDNKNIKVTQIFDEYSGHYYKLYSCSKNANLIVECEYREDNESISNAYGVFRSKSLVHTSGVWISVYGEGNNIIRYYIAGKNGSVKSGIWNMHEKEINQLKSDISNIDKKGHNQYIDRQNEEFQAILKVISEKCDAFTVSFVTSLLNEIEEKEQTTTTQQLAITEMQNATIVDRYTLKEENIEMGL